MISGGGGGRIDRPIANPAIRVPNNNAPNRIDCSRMNLGEQPSQNFLLVQGFQRSRMIFSPHSAQNFGRYMND